MRSILLAIAFSVPELVTGTGGEKKDMNDPVLGAHSPAQIMPSFRDPGEHFPARVPNNHGQEKQSKQVWMPGWVNVGPHSDSTTTQLQATQESRPGALPVVQK